MPSPASRVSGRRGCTTDCCPMLDVILEQPMGERFVMLALQRTDERILDEKGVSPGFLFAALLWHEVLATWNAAQGRGVPPVPRDARSDGSGALDAGREDLDPATLRCRHEGHLAPPVAFSNSARASVRTAFSRARSSAPATTSCSCVARAARWRRKWVNGGPDSRTPRSPSARRCCCRPTRREVRRSVAVVASPVAKTVPMHRQAPPAPVGDDV